MIRVDTDIFHIFLADFSSKGRFHVPSTRMENGANWLILTSVVDAFMGRRYQRRNKKATQAPDA